MITKQLRNMEVGDRLEFEFKDRSAISQAIYRLHKGGEVYSSRVVEDKPTNKKSVMVVRIR